ncbi:MAG TPA: hypothetical protein VFZ89_14200 [Solirubrobacteraceae bacterium]
MTQREILRHFARQLQPAWTPRDGAEIHQNWSRGDLWIGVTVVEYDRDILVSVWNKPALVEATTLAPNKRRTMPIHQDHPPPRQDHDDAAIAPPRPAEADARRHEFRRRPASASGGA